MSKQEAEDFVFDVLIDVFRANAAAMAELAEIIVVGVKARLPDLDEPPALHKNPSPAQVLTFEQALESASKRRRQVLTAVIEHYDEAHPMTTSDYIEEQTGLPHTTVSATLNWLEKTALLVERDHSIIRETSVGGRASPYCPLPAGQVAYRRWGPLHT